MAMHCSAFVDAFTSELPAGAQKGSACLDVKHPPRTRRISRRAKGRTCPW